MRLTKLTYQSDINIGERKVAVLTIRDEPRKGKFLHDLHSPFMPSSPRAISMLSEASHVFVLLITAGFFIISCVILLSQAVRTSPNQSWLHNYNALIIGASYVVVVSTERLLLHQYIATHLLLISLLYPWRSA